METNIHSFEGKAKGKRDPINRLSVKFGDFLTTLPSVPLVDIAPSFTYPMDGNDSVGDCVVAGWDHFRQVVTGLLTGTQKNFTQDQIWNFYKTQNPNFDPNGTKDTNGPGSSSDNGMCIQTFLEYLVSQKLILGFAKVDHTNEAELKAAIYIGLGLITGVIVDDAQMTDQFQNGVWDYVPNSKRDGGHCIPLIGYNNSPDECACVTWAKLVQCTESFIFHQMDEAWFVLMQEHVDHPSFRNHFDLAAFSNAVKQITGGKIVIPVPPVMPVVNMKRNSDNGVETLGTLTYGKFSCFTLERPWKNNQPNISCIPKGAYKCVWAYHNGLKEWHYQLQNVLGRSGVFIHEGNFASGKKVDTEGCILLGNTKTDINKDGQIDVGNSKITLVKFEQLMNKQPFILTIS